MTAPTSAGPLSADEQRKAIEAECGKYRAASVIEVNGVRAFNPGDPVPVSTVEAGIVPSDAVYDISKSAQREKADDVNKVHATPDEGIVPREGKDALEQ